MTEPAITADVSAGATPAFPFVSLSVAAVWGGSRRLDAENFLATGYGVRLQVESLNHALLSEIADVVQVPRLKGTSVAPDHGIPLMTASQAFQIRPTTRKWYAPGKVPKLQDRLVDKGWILVTRSGTVGRAIVTYSPHLTAVVAEHVLRLRLKDDDKFGLLYSYVRGRYGRLILRSSQYGSIVRHLEREHLLDVPVPEVERVLERQLTEQIRQVFEWRERAYRVTLEAEAMFGEALGGDPNASEPVSYLTGTSALFGQRRRLDAYHHNPVARQALRRLEKYGVSVGPLKSVVTRVFGVPRFKHVYKSEGVPYLDSEDLFRINPEITKFIPPAARTNAEKYLVRRDWLLMACSGQIYGLNGSVVLAGPWHEEKIVSNHVVRIICRQSGENAVRPGYLQMALGHPTLGRPLVTRLAFGSEVPEISPEDLEEQFPVVRLASADEGAIADRVERAARLRSQADELEDGAVEALEGALDEMVHGHPPSAENR